MAKKRTTVQGFQAGDAVTLKHGMSPIMTIERIRNGYADCVWFAGFTEDMNRSKVETSALKKYIEPKVSRRKAR